MTETKTITCKDCGVTFDVTPEEQAWFAERGWEIPKRCKSCRRANKEKKQNRKKEDRK